MRLFVQNQILRMQWLNELVGAGLQALGVDLASPFGGSVRFFIYDVLKITGLLCVLIFIVSYIQSYFPPERSKKIVGRFHGIGANAAAALLGVATPFCSCSSIPLFIGFTSAGLPIGVTFSFLIASPMVDLGSLALLTSVFGVRLAFAYVTVGVLVAIAGGVMIEKMHMENEIEDVVRNARGAEIAVPEMTVKDRVQYAKEQTVRTFKKVCLYIFAGVGIGAVIHNWIPESWIVTILGNHNPFGVVLATIVGIPMYGDIFGAIPIAESLLAKGAMLGTTLAFMTAVTTLSLPSMIMLRKAIKPKLLGVFIVVCTVGIVLIGYLFNELHSFFI